MQLDVMSPFVSRDGSDVQETHRCFYVKPFPHLDCVRGILLHVQAILIHGSDRSVEVRGHVGERMIGGCAETDSQTDGEWRCETFLNHVGERMQRCCWIGRHRGLD